MTPVDILEHATAEGVALTLSLAGAITVAGGQQVVDKWLPIIRDHKPELVQVLRAAEQWREFMSLLGIVGPAYNTPAHELDEIRNTARDDLSSALILYRLMVPNTKAIGKTLHPQAARLAADVKVSARITEIRASFLAKVPQELAYEHAEAMKELDGGIAFARSNGHSSTVVAALNLKQKISGLHVAERRNELSPVSGMTYAQMKAALEALAAWRKSQMKGN